MQTAPFWITRSLSFGLGGAASYGVKNPPLRLASAGIHPFLSHPAGRVFKWNGFEIEAFALEQAAEHQAEWADLISRALESNAFYEPAFALSAARHFPAKSRPLFVTVWREASDQGGRRLVGLCPIVVSNPLLGAGLARVWLHKQAALATPLLDQADASLAVEALFAWFARSLPAAAIVFPKIPKRGPTFAALVAGARAAGLQWRTFDEYDRAVLRSGGDADELCVRGDSREALKELRRRRRRLNDLGPVEHVLLSGPEEVRGATEDFLAMEAAGWKGSRNAFLTQPYLTTFARSVTRLLAREGKCRIHALVAGGRPIAMGIVIESRGRAYFWKIAYDERFRSQAPGIHLAYELTKTEMARGDLDMTDSCAIANHPMIDRLWPDRFMICDLVIQSRRGRDEAFAAVCSGEAMRRRIRLIAKTAVNRLLRRKVS
ncbi:MAG: GNAT family N-acetyltransferase [Methylocystis sp.]|nr:GNAT family N-acetyltransferase [Methylocystis sp.]